MNSLATLLRPSTREEFLQNHWTQRAIALSGKGQRSFTDLFSWEELNALLNFHQIKYPDLRLAMDGKVLDESENSKLLQWCRQGATLIITQVHQRVPKIATFAAALQQELGYPTQVNAYCSWSGQQGFKLHYDTHEVFALQVIGEKQWFVYPETFPVPLPSQRFTDADLPQGDPYLSCTLYPGDVLYIPRGHWHYAKTVEAPSIHLTLGVHCKTGIHFLEWLASEFSSQEVWRKSLPLQPETLPGLEDLVQDLAQYLTHQNVAESYHRYLMHSAQSAPQYALPYQAGFNLFPDRIDTHFKTAPYQNIQILSDDPSECQVFINGKAVSLKGISPTLAEQLFSQTEFTGRDVMAWFSEFDWELDLIPLLSRLVLEGIIFVEAEH
ncbi:MAG: cupin [Oscillatoriales cyanobacterium RM2_1_1]|nr:cupin [Oscillatoriales cyanobacterium RM2_1_1]